MNYCRAAASVFCPCLLAALLLLAGRGVGQGRAAFIAPGSYDKYTRDPTLRYEPGSHPGTFRGLDGQWHPVQIAGWLTDRVYMNETGDYYRAFSPEDMTAFVDSYADTVVTVAGLPPGKLGRFSAVFGRQKFRGAGMQLVDVTDEARSLLDLLIMPHRLVIRKDAAGWLLVPRQKAAFRQLMLVLLADDPALVAELRAGRTGRRHLPRLLAQYADTRTTRFLQTAAQPRP
ncbi:hypothetical protein SAMN02745146_2404 [Hymenobacter daecheongensis DSM 21074]|uniref:Uncharacterized protein n=1 Tax=Hymenobacter daecheongensis DSM 21074 TaxID=1121955 RepID=A0A1M6GUZ8_9BACT|nr:hypothetical protein [Hymenobacter daecheongensis]SHJ13791.1 hypothetical protein SAMN02745146_2404 [Hymenobacter daecheongensis DSM 21074]